MKKKLVITKNYGAAKYFFLLISLIVVPLAMFSQQSIKHEIKNIPDVTKGYEIKAHIEGLKEGEKVIMHLVYGSNGATRRDSAYVKNGEFAITGFVPEGPRLYAMEFEKHPSKRCQLFIDNNEQITIRSTNIDQINHSILEHWMSINGSPSFHAWNCLQEVLLNYRQNRGNIYNYLNELKDSIGFDPKLVNCIMNTYQMLTRVLYREVFENPEPDYRPAISLAVYLHLLEFCGHSSVLADIYSNLNDREKNSYYGKIMKEIVPLCIGKPFPEFSLPDIEGKRISSKDIITKSKVTLVEFWASNSVDVDMYQQELLALYKKYHGKGLNIVGVSSDSVAKKWKIGATDLPWYHVSDLKGREGIVNKVYNEYGASTVPNTTNVLIDADGKILAWDVSGLELQWYLWKAFGE